MQFIGIKMLFVLYLFVNIVDKLCLHQKPIYETTENVMNSKMYFFHDVQT